eukprot:SAG31_NODE_3923_length_3749_cov_2.030685_4_plen_534_part_00
MFVLFCLRVPLLLHQLKLYCCGCIVDWGCQFTGPDAACFLGNYRFFGSYDANSHIFFGLWWFSLIWFGTLIACKDRVKLWFRLRCPLHEATFAHVWQADHDENLLVDPSLPVRVVMKLQEKFRKLKGAPSNGHEASVPIHPNGDGSERFFIFECCKFILTSSGGLVKAQVQVGPTFAEFYEQAERGISRQELEHRQLLLGENMIPYEVDTWSEAAKKEFFSFFYLYQLMSYTIWLWFSYMIMALILMSIVVSAGIVNIALSISNQKSIKRLTTYRTTCEAKRSTAANPAEPARWVSCDSTSLVPGDVIKIRATADNDASQGPWILPCDLLLTKGTVVLDESGLTGESMPVRKVAIDRTSRAYYDVHKHSRHSLFAGTGVLQAGSDGEEVEGIVTKTGVYTSKGELISSILFPAPMNFKYDLELPIAFLMLFIFACFGFVLSLYFQQLNGAKSSWATKWVYCMVTVGQVVSPLIPVVLVVGQQQSSKRLKDRGVFCLNPKRIVSLSHDFVIVKTCILLPGSSLEFCFLYYIVST